MGRRICISVIGAGGEITPEEASTAAELGREIARRGAVVICGGLGGVMTEVAKGAKEEGGLTIGIIPGDNPAGANPFIDVAIVTGMGIARNVIVASSGDAVIAVSGKLGTLSEIALALIRSKWEARNTLRDCPCPYPWEACDWFRDMAIGRGAHRRPFNNSCQKCKRCRQKGTITYREIKVEKDVKIFKKDLTNPFASSIFVILSVARNLTF
ncbi:MAG: TIGR00725 family protein [Planctomycetes bacterium]|nr:TIGR00725 family protein [Planctomycetota bacterium]